MESIIFITRIFILYQIVNYYKKSNIIIKYKIERSRNYYLNEHFVK